MRIFLLVILSFCLNSLFAQKQIIDSNAYKEWPSLGQVEISNNGRYVKYIIQNVPVGSSSVIVKSIDGKWKKEFVGQEIHGMTKDSKYLLFRKGKDSLAMLQMGTDQISYVSNISSYELYDKFDMQILCYHPIDKPRSLVLKYLKGKKEKSFDNVITEQFVGENRIMILYQDSKYDHNNQVVKWVDLATNKINGIWEGTSPKNLKVDARHEQVVFTIGDSLMYYKLGSTSSTCLIKSISSIIGDNMTFDCINDFTRDGNSLLISLKEKEKLSPLENAVEIWSYNDISLLTEQKNDLSVNTFLAKIELDTKEIILFEQTKGDGFRFPQDIDAPDSVALVVNDQRLLEKWSLYSKIENSLLSLKTGEKRKLTFLNDNHTVIVSPNGKYLIYFNPVDRNYYSYEIKTNVVRNLTHGLSVKWMDTEDATDRYDSNISPREFYKQIWSKDGSSLLVYDSHDIWKLDPLNRIRPVNITNGYGKRHNIVFKVIMDSYEKGFTNKEKIYLTAFNTDSKENGFYLKDLGKVEDPHLLTMGKYVFFASGRYATMPSNFSTIKAKNAEVYVVRRMSSVEAPNYFATRNFKTFAKLTDLQPQKKYNWYTTELHSWKSLDGRVLSGLLYKPENFDPAKKYPIIFFYYERLSNGLNVFLKPESFHAGLNIPTFVSNEYLVFCPDIYYTVGNPMKGTYDAVISATEYISKFPFVNSKKMGIQGQSFGGVQTDYLVANTNIFAAACSTAGFADWTSAYGALFGDGRSLQQMFEYGQLRMNGSPWEMQDRYLKNSASYNLYKITTPLLLLNNRKDPSIPYSDAIAFFTGLRRLGKKAWLLSYPNGDHEVEGKDANDFSIRMMQFFDHYLKDKPAPIWMTRGIKSSRRGLDDGFAYDTEIKTPGPGLLKSEEQAKLDSLMKRKPLISSLK